MSLNSYCSISAAADGFKMAVLVSFKGSNELVGHSEDTVSGHGLHAAGQVHSFHAQPHFKHNTLDFVRLQHVTPDKIEIELQIEYPVRHYFEPYVILPQPVAHEDCSLVGLSSPDLTFDAPAPADVLAIDIT